MQDGEEEEDRKMSSDSFIAANNIQRQSIAPGFGPSALAGG